MVSIHSISLYGGAFLFRGGEIVDHVMGCLGGLTQAGNAWFGCLPGFFCQFPPGVTHADDPGNAVGVLHDAILCLLLICGKLLRVKVVPLVVVTVLVGVPVGWWFWLLLYDGDMCWVLLCYPPALSSFCCARKNSPI